MSSCVDLLFVFFLFKQKTAYEMRISDWSSDVCSSDLGAFEQELLPIVGVDAAGRPVMHDADEGVRSDVSLAAMAELKPLREGGMLTAATSSQISDGASGVIVVSEAGLKALSLPPLARIHHMTVLGASPVTRLDAPIPATARALERTGMRIEEGRKSEIKEAVASITGRERCGGGKGGYVQVEAG